jgi:hypothetical protein
VASAAFRAASLRGPFPILEVETWPHDIYPQGRKKGQRPRDLT